MSWPADAVVPGRARKLLRSRESDSRPHDLADRAVAADARWSWRADRRGAQLRGVGPYANPGPADVMNHALRLPGPAWNWDSTSRTSPGTAAPHGSRPRWPKWPEARRRPESRG